MALASRSRNRRRGLPKALVELNTLGRTLNKRADDVLTYFDRPGTANGPTEAINGRWWVGSVRAVPHLMHLTDIGRATHEGMRLYPFIR